MRLAVLSDIHGNITALKRCFEIIDKIKINGLVFCGDYISDVPQSKEVLEYIRMKSKQYKVWIVNGNREEYLINYHENSKKKWTMESNNAAFLVAYNSLNEEDIKYLQEMKKEVVIDLPNTKKIYVTHKYKDIKIDDNFKYKYVIFGHTHHQSFFSKDGIRFFNPGSVGLPGDGFPGASLLILEFKNNHWLPIFYHLEYDINIPVKIIKNSEINNEKVRWGDVLIEALKTGTDQTGMYIREVKRLALEQGLTSVLEQVPSEIWALARKNLNLD